MNFQRIRQQMREGGATEAEIEDHMDYILARDRAEDLTPPPGYTAEELDRDNPYDQWMYEGGLK